MDSDQPPDADAAEKRVEDSREQLDRHLDRLSEQLSPSNLAASALDQLRPIDRIKQALGKKAVWAMLGAAVGLVAVRRWRREAKHDRP